MNLNKSQIERSEGPFLTRIGEFKYSDDNESVRREQEYSIYYLTSKAVVYLLNVNNKQIVRKQKVQQEIYQLLKPEKSRDVYPKQIYKTSKDIKFKSNIIKRTFARNKLEKNAPIIEVSGRTSTNSYQFITINWKVSGTQEEAIFYNSKVLKKAEGKMPGISELLPPTQLHKEKILQFD